MDEIEQRIADRRDELRASLEPIFGEDSNNTASMMIGALRREFGNPIKEDNRPRFLEALAVLPGGHNAKPTRLIDRLSDTPPFGLIFLVEGTTRYRSSRRFDDEDAANRYASWFLIRLSELRSEAAPADEP